VEQTCIARLRDCHHRSRIEITNVSSRLASYFPYEYSAFNFPIFQKIIPSTSYATRNITVIQLQRIVQKKQISQSRSSRNHRFWKWLRDIYRANNRLAWTGCFLSRSGRSHYASNVEFSCIVEHRVRIGDIAWLRKSRSHVAPDSGTIHRVVLPRVRLNFPAQRVISRHPWASVPWNSVSQFLRSRVSFHKKLSRLYIKEWWRSSRTKDL